MRRWPPSPAGVLILLGIAAAYFGTARVGLLLAMAGGNVTPVWPPSGIAFAALLIFGARVWPGIWIGAFAANFWGAYYTASGVSLAPALMFAAGASTGAVLTAWLGVVLTQRVAGTGNPLERVRDVCALMGLGGVTACLLSASNGVLWLATAGLAPRGEWGSIWLTWWLGDTAGVLVFAPLLIAWCLAPSFPKRTRWPEAAGCFALLLAAGGIMFDGALLPTLSAGHFTFLIIPFLVWPALRLGQRGAATATLAVACLAVWGAIHGEGPFILATRNETLLLLELFLSVVALSGLCVAAVATGQSRAEAERSTVLDELESRVRGRTAELVAEIAEHERTEGRLADREAHLRAIVDSEPECVKLLSAEGTLLEMNPAGLAMIEAESFEQVRGANMARLLAPGYREPFAKLTQRVFGGLSGGLEFEITGLKGTHRWLETHAVPLRGADGGITAMLGITRDITGRKQAADALRHERDFSATVIDSLPGVFYLVDPRRRLRRWNKNFERVTGYTAIELGNMDVSRLFPPAELLRVQESFFKVLETGSADVEAELLPREGPPVPYFFTGMRVMLRDTPCMAGVGIDVTERRRAAAVIEGQKSVLELIAKGAPLAETLTVLLRVVEALAPEMLCSVLLLDPDGIHVRHGAAPSLPDAFNRAVDGQPIGPSAGSCGTAAFRREPVIVEDIATDPLWADYRAAALPHGLRACWSTPIFDEKRTVLGTFAIYSRKPARPTSRHLHCIELATGLAAIAISRTRSRAALEKMRFSVERAGDGVFWISPEGRVLYVNRSACERLGYSQDEILGMTIPISIRIIRPTRGRRTGRS